MPGTALVLSGGGARGAFQYAAEKYAREDKGYKWDIISGVSVGALNGTFVAMKKYKRLDELWDKITPGMVMTGKLNFLAALKILLGAKSIFGHEPLKKILENEIEVGKITVDLRIGVVSLMTSEYKAFTPQDPGFISAVLASTAIPLVWPPVDISPGFQHMVDGGVRNVSPLGDVLDSDPDEVVIINCEAQDPAKLTEPPDSFLKIGMRTLEIMLSEIINNDVREFIRINEMVQQADKQGVKLVKKNGKPYKYYKSHIIQPDKPLADTLDFSGKATKESMRIGRDKAIQVLN
jgi:NTE family protein